MVENILAFSPTGLLPGGYTYTTAPAPSTGLDSFLDGLSSSALKAVDGFIGREFPERTENVRSGGVVTDTAVEQQKQLLARENISTALKIGGVFLAVVAGALILRKVV